MREIAFLRHGQTPGNRAGRYVGRTDEALSPEGIAALDPMLTPAADRLYMSPMARCVQTAALLYPHLTPMAVLDLRECDFGDFEYKNHQELSEDPRYQAWIDAGGSLPFPGGETPEGFRARCRAAFAALLADPRTDGLRLVLVVHGGTIMSILEGFALPKRDYFDYQVQNGHGYLCTEQGGVLTVTSRI